MKKDRKGKFFISNKLIKNNKKMTLNIKMDLSRRNKIIKNLKIDSLNLNSCLNAINNISSKRITNFKNYITSNESHTNINTATIFSKRENTEYSHNEKRYSKRDDEYKEKDKLSMANINNNRSIKFNVYKNYNKNKNFYLIPKTDRNKDYINTIKNTFLNNKTVDFPKTRNNAKNIYNNENNCPKTIWKDTINFKTNTNINAKNYYVNKKCNALQNNFDEFQKSHKLKIESKIKLSKTKRKIINIKIPNSSRTKSSLNNTITNIKYQNLKSGKFCQCVLKEKRNTNTNHSKINKSYNKDKILIRYKSNKIPIIKENFLKAKSEINIKKTKKSLSPKRMNFNSLFIKTNPSSKNKKSSKKLIPISKNTKNKRAINIHIYDLKDENSNSIFESDNDESKKINEIKTNKFSVKKPNEENLKYTIFEEFNDDKNISESKISKISKVIIGKIDGYNDIIEKDKTDNFFNKNLTNNMHDDNFLLKDSDYNLNRGEKKKILLNDSLESEKRILKMINFEHESDKISTDDCR